MKQTRQAITFPGIVSAFGGAQRVEYSTRFAWIYLPGKALPVRKALSSLPPVHAWSAFSLANACA